MRIPPDPTRRARFPRRGRRRALRAAAAIALCGALADGPAFAQKDPPESVEAVAEGEIAAMSDAELRAAIVREQTRLLELLARPGTDEEARALHVDPELREVAARLPALQRQLREREGVGAGLSPERIPQ